MATSTTISARHPSLFPAVRLLLALVVPALFAAPSTASAAPPHTLFDLSKALTVYDVARLASYTAKPQPASAPLSNIRTIVLDPGHGGENEGAVGVLGVHEKYLTVELALELRDRLQRAHPSLRVVLTRYWDHEIGLSERIALANHREADLFISLHYNAAVHDRAVGFETYFLATEQAVPAPAPGTDAPGTKTPLASDSGSCRAATEARGDKLPLVPGEGCPAPDTSLPEPDADAPPSGVAPTQDALERVVDDLHQAVQHRRSGRLAEIVQRHLRARLKSVSRGVKQANFAVLRGARMPAVVVESAFLTHPKEGKTVKTLDHRTRVVEALMEAIVAFDRTLKAEQTPAPSDEPHDKT